MCSWGRLCRGSRQELANMQEMEPLPPLTWPPCLEELRSWWYTQIPPLLKPHVFKPLIPFQSWVNGQSNWRYLYIERMGTIAREYHPITQHFSYRRQLEEFCGVVLGLWKCVSVFTREKNSSKPSAHWSSFQRCIPYGEIKALSVSTMLTSFSVRKEIFFKVTWLFFWYTSHTSTRRSEHPPWGRSECLG